MAEPTTSDSSPDTDRDFDPSADMMIHDFDDERTLEEEEALSNSGSVNELDQLQKESEMPMEDLLSVYGYGAGTLPEPDSHGHDTRSSSEEEILSNQDLTLDKEEIARDLLQNDADHDKETSVNDLMDSVQMPSHTVRLLRSTSHAGSSDDEMDDEDYEPEQDDWKKTIQVGSDYQAVVPDGLCKYGDAPAHENEDCLLWDPTKLVDAEVENYLKEACCKNMQAAQGVQAIPQGTHIRDDEQALYLLLQCGHNVDEALRRRKIQVVPPTDPMSLWSEEECRNFENGLKTYGKDFYLIQQNKVRTRSVGELAQFYYLWKKTERHDVFANKTRLEKKKYALHPGITDYMERFLDEQESTPARDRSASPINSLLYGDPKRHPHDLRPTAAEATHDAASEADLAVAMELVQKVVDPTKLDFSPFKMNPELDTASPTTMTLHPALQHSPGGSLPFSSHFTPIHPPGTPVSRHQHSSPNHLQTTTKSPKLEQNPTHCGEPSEPSPKKIKICHHEHSPVADSGGVNAVPKTTAYSSQTATNCIWSPSRSLPSLTTDTVTSVTSSVATNTSIDVIRPTTKVVETIAPSNQSSLKNCDGHMDKVALSFSSVSSSTLRSLGSGDTLHREPSSLTTAESVAQ